MPLACSEPCIICGPAGGGEDTPFLNLSSEAPDASIFLGRAYTPFDPPLGKFFYSTGCIGFCFSSVSQADADLCAQRQNAICNASNWPTSGGGGGSPVTRTNSQVFPNQRQVGLFTCPDGTQFTFTVNAGAFFGASTAQANAFARSYANNQAARTAICLSPLSPDRICANVTSSVTFFASNIVGIVEFAVVAGTLPPGMSLISDGGPTGTILGIPSAPGDYAFTIGVTDQSGGYAEHPYTISVIQITNSSPLPAATVGTAYSQQINVGGTPDGAFSYTVSGGSLPAGLTLNATTGIISGTPTLAGTSNFTVQVQDSSLTCSRNFSITTASAFNCLGNPSSVSAAVWTQGPSGAMPPCGVWTIVNGVGTFTLTYNLTTCPNNGMNINSTLCNPGAPYDITITMPWDDGGNVGAGVHIVQLSVFINGNPPGVGGQDTKDLVTGPFTPFVVKGTIPTGAANTIQIQLAMLATPSPEVVVFSNGNLTITPLTPP